MKYEKEHEKLLRHLTEHGVEFYDAEWWELDADTQDWAISIGDCGAGVECYLTSTGRDFYCYDSECEVTMAGSVHEVMDWARKTFENVNLMSNK